MNKQKEMTAFISSVDADERQPLNISDNSISEKAGKINDLETISMTELYDTVYQSKPPLIDGLLYAGAYLFVGATKLGKSFLMAQLAYHISTGTPLCGIIPSEKERCCILPSKMITAACRNGYTECLEQTAQTIFSFLFQRTVLEMG